MTSVRTIAHVLISGLIPITTALSVAAQDNVRLGDYGDTKSFSSIRQPDPPRIAIHLDDLAVLELSGSVGNETEDS